MSDDPGPIDPTPPIVITSVPAAIPGSTTIAIPIVAPTNVWSYSISSSYGTNWLGGIDYDSASTPPAAKVKKSVGCTCKKCKTFNEYAEANQPDDTFICYGCRVKW